MEDVREAVQEAVAAATVGAALPDPLAVRDQATPPTEEGGRETLRSCNDSDDAERMEAWRVQFT